MTFSNHAPWLFIALALVVLLPLTWYAWKGSNSGKGHSRSLALGCRILGILFIAIAIADPQVIEERPITGANVVALLADDSLGMRIKDSESILDRGETLRQRLSGRNSEWIGSLSEQYQIRNYRFERSLQRVASFDSLTFEGQQSNIATALLESQQRLSQVPLAGIVLFSDGNATDQELSPNELAKLPPVFPVLVGSSTPVPDIALQNLTLRQSAFGDSPLRIETKLTNAGLPTQQVRTRLRQIKANPSRIQSALTNVASIVDEKILELADSASLSFEWTPKDGGIQFYETEAEAIPAADAPAIVEATLNNNRRIVVADRGKDTYRILYLTGRPNWEYKFLNRALAEDPQLDIVGLIRVASREPNFEFKGRAGENSNSLYRGFGREDENERYDESVLIRMNTRDEAELRAGFPNQAEALFEYDAIVIDDLEADFFTFSQQALIRDFVKQRGGGLLMLGGVNALEDGGYDDTPIAEALPLYLDRFGPAAPIDRTVQWNLTRDGWVEPWMRIRSFETDERRRMQEMPLFRVYNTLERIKPGARALATIEDSGAQSYPALVTRNYGSGRVATLALGDLWRWGMQDAGSQADLAQFWRQISRWLVKDNLRRIELNSTRNDANKTALTAYARDGNFRPMQAGTATLFVKQLTQGDTAVDKAIELELAMKPGSNKPGQFSIELPLVDEGAYHARVQITSADGTVSGEAETGWVNQPLVQEFAALTPNRDYLAKIAEATGGRLLELNQLAQLQDELTARPSPLMESWSKPMWHNNWLFCLALAALLAEWFIRRKRGLA
ncbi:conserved hypothetical protein [Verrucomicrobiia bacterium DG1235]|nr:conserved hypothetical protein [Verrucomicrobiae bacterium DG1235]